MNKKPLINQKLYRAGKIAGYIQAQKEIEENGLNIEGHEYILLHSEQCKCKNE